MPFVLVHSTARHDVRPHHQRKIDPPVIREPRNSCSTSCLVLLAMFGLGVIEPPPTLGSAVMAGRGHPVDQRPDDPCRCCCGLACSKKACCCQPAEPTPIHLTLENRRDHRESSGLVSRVKSACFTSTPCRESGQSPAPSLVQITKSHAFAARMVVSTPEEWIALGVVGPGEAPPVGVYPIDRPPRSQAG